MKPSRADLRGVRGELSNLATAVDAAGPHAPVLTVVGGVAGCDPEMHQ